MHLLRPADTGEGLLEPDPDAERGPLADVRDDEEEQPALEEDVEDHLRVAALGPHRGESTAVGSGAAAEGSY